MGQYPNAPRRPRRSQTYNSGWLRQKMFGKRSGRHCGMWPQTISCKLTNKQRPQAPFYDSQWIYLFTKYLKLKVPCNKLGPKYIGPFPVVKVINPITVQLQLPWLLGKTHPVFCCNLLRPAHSSQIQGPYSQPPPLVIVDGNQHYEVKEELDAWWHRGWLALP